MLTDATLTTVIPLAPKTIKAPSMVFGRMANSTATASTNFGEYNQSAQIPLKHTRVSEVDEQCIPTETNMTA